MPGVSTSGRPPTATCRPVRRTAMVTGPARPIHRLGRLVGVLVSAAGGIALTWVFCDGYIWKAQDPRRGPGHLPWEPGSLYALTVLEYTILGAFIIRAAMRARSVALLW